MQFWYKKYSIIPVALLPLSGLFYGITLLRRGFYKYIHHNYTAKTPVVVIGNIAVGGTGKTPTILFLAQQLSKRGLKVGIIARGYKSQNTEPLIVDENSTPLLVGDEPYLVWQNLHLPVAVNRSRRKTCELLTQEYALDVILSDDGMQHYALNRQYEIVLIDSVKQFGNGFLLPAGPLRETKRRLRTVNACIVKGRHKFTYKTDYILDYTIKYAVNPKHNRKILLTEFIQQDSKAVLAMAGIASPEQFFTSLLDAGFTILKSFPVGDHNTLSQAEFTSLTAGIEAPLFMTEKDAVKYSAIWQDNWWYIPLEANIENGNILVDDIIKTIGL